MGFENVTVIKEQAEPNGNGQFPTVVYPNPEESEAMDTAVKRPGKLTQTTVMGTDRIPDRVGIAAKESPWRRSHNYSTATRTASLLIYYLLNAWKRPK